jgi:hypothetical protein
MKPAECRSCIGKRLKERSEGSATHLQQSPETLDKENNCTQKENYLSTIVQDTTPTPPPAAVKEKELAISRSRIHDQLFFDLMLLKNSARVFSFSRKMPDIGCGERSRKRNKGKNKGKTTSRP